MNKKRLVVTLVLLITPGLLLAARPSINELNTRVNQLEAENNAQQAEIDALRTDVDDNTNRIDALPTTLVILDSNDKMVGTGYIQESIGTATVFFSLNDRLISLFLRHDRFYQGRIFYDQLDCLGTPYVSPVSEVMIELGQVRGTSVFFPIPNTIGPPLLPSRWEDPGTCVNDTSQGLGKLRAETTFDVSEFTPPFRFSVAPP